MVNAMMASTPTTSRRDRDCIDPVRREEGSFMLGGILLPAAVVAHAL
jgi:hypothetical protein